MSGKPAICFCFLVQNQCGLFPGRKNARTCFANSGVMQVFEPGLSILKDSLLEALKEVAFRMQNSNCLGRPGIKSLSQKPHIIIEFYFNIVQPSSWYTFSSFIRRPRARLKAALEMPNLALMISAGVSSQ